MFNYYSALDKKDTALYYEPVERVDAFGSVALRLDLEKEPLPEEYRSCDVIYAEPPWTAGYTKFKDRAGAEIFTIDKLYKKIDEIIHELNKPTFITHGKKESVYFTGDRIELDIRLRGKARVSIFNCKSLDGLDLSDNFKLIGTLSDRYDVVGDFCCGYGMTGKIFANKGKKFVMSDVNPRCIGFIKTNLASWYENI